LAKVLKEGASYNQRDIIELMIEFSSFKDRVSKKFKNLASELEGKANEHELWVNLFLIACDYAEEVSIRKNKQDSLQKIS